MLFHRAALFWNRIAIIDSAGPHSYARLDGRSAAVAHGLLDGRPNLKEQRVAFLEPPGFGYAALQWGIWRAGGIAVPLAISYPPPELGYVLDDAGASIVVAHPSLSERLAPLALERGLRFADTTKVVDGPLAAAGQLPSIAATRRAMMVYTSGTTGKPKGVVSTHANIHAQITTLVEAWRWRPDDRILHVLPLHHIHGIINVLSCALWTGACCEFLPDFESVAVWERLASGEITLFMAVPTIYGRLIAEWEQASVRDQQRWSAGARGLRLMVSGSAALPAPTLARWRDITGHTLLERYGMTEIGMGLSNPLVGERRAGTVGQPLPGVDARIVDEAGGEAPAGTPGQIEIRGAQVFLEYWGRPEATEAAFRDGWFQTGDVAVVEDGYYRILGRANVDIIKSGGYKISALEIEDTLREHSGVRDCAVVGVDDADLGERVVAAVVSRSDGLIDAETLRAWAKQRLAPYKVPRQVLMVADLPRNAMGKVTKAEVKKLFG